MAPLAKATISVRRDMGTHTSVAKPRVPGRSDSAAYLQLITTGTWVRAHGNHHALCRAFHRRWRWSACVTHFEKKPPLLLTMSDTSLSWSFSDVSVLPEAHVMHAI